MTTDEIQKAMNVTMSILGDCNKFGWYKPAESQPSALGQPIQAPVSKANVEAQPAGAGDGTQQSQRAGSKGPGAQPAAAAAGGGAQASFSLGALSPHGQPKYMTAPKDMNLHIPPKKKAKANHAKQQGPSAGGTAAATPEIKQEHKPPVKPAFYCTEPDCEAAAVGFATEEARQMHVQTEHIQPNEDPRKFFQENLAASLGVDLDGNVLGGANAGPQQNNNTPQGGAGTMSATQSKQGQTPASFAPTPMSRGLSMNRSASGAGARQQQAKAQEMVKTEGSKAGGAPGTGGKGTPKQQPAAAPTADAFDSSTIDPQALFADVPGFNSVAGGVFTDPTFLQTLSPNNDTPDSKGSGTTEAASELPDPAGLGGELDADWQQFGDAYLMLGGSEMDLQGLGTTGEVDQWDRGVLLDAMEPTMQDINWDEVNVDFAKAPSLDTSLYSMDPTVSSG